jgi:hypothetical protein
VENAKRADSGIDNLLLALDEQPKAQSQQSSRVEMMRRDDFVIVGRATANTASARQVALNLTVSAVAPSSSLASGWSSELCLAGESTCSSPAGCRSRRSCS